MGPGWTPRYLRAHTPEALGPRGCFLECFPHTGQAGARPSLPAAHTWGGCLPWLRDAEWEAGVRRGAHADPARTRSPGPQPSSSDPEVLEFKAPPPRSSETRTPRRFRLRVRTPETPPGATPRGVKPAAPGGLSSCLSFLRQAPPPPAPPTSLPTRGQGERGAGSRSRRRGGSYLGRPPRLPRLPRRGGGSSCCSLAAGTPLTRRLLAAHAREGPGRGGGGAAPDGGGGAGGSRLPRAGRDRRSPAWLAQPSTRLGPRRPGASPLLPQT